MYMTATFGSGNVTLSLGLERDILQKRLLMPTANFDFGHPAKLPVSLDRGFCLDQRMSSLADRRLKRD